MSGEHEVDAYAAAVLCGEVLANRHVRAAARRHQEDRVRVDIRFDETLADHALTFFRQVLKVPAGPHAGKPFEPLPWHVFLIGSLFGWVNVGDGSGLRRFRRAYVETPKGAGKSPIAAGIGLYMLVADMEPKVQGYVVARTADQGKPMFRAAVDMVKGSPVLSRLCKIRGGLEAEYQIVIPDGGFLWRWSSDRHARGRSGPSPHVVLVDELHEHDSGAMLEVMNLGTKDRRQPLTLITTNAGESMETACGREHGRAVAVLENRTVLDSLFALIFSVDDKDDPWTDEGCWPKAHPSLSLGLPGYPYLREQTNEARSLPSKRTLVDRLLWGRWGGGTGTWIEPESWRAIEVEPDEAPSEDVLRECVSRLAIDLSVRRDLTAAAHLWELPDGHHYARVQCWIPKDGLAERSIQDDVPFDAWVEDGYLTACEGPVINYDTIAQWIIGQHESWPRLRGCAYDPAKIDRLRASLERENASVTSDPRALGRQTGRIVLLPHPQSWVGGMTKRDENKVRLWMPQSIEDLEAAAVNLTLSVLRSPVLRWAALGASVIIDDSKNRRWTKSRSGVLIDPIVALSMAEGLSCALKDAPGGIPMFDGYADRDEEAETPPWLKPL